MNHRQCQARALSSKNGRPAVIEMGEVFSRAGRTQCLLLLLVSPTAAAAAKEAATRLLLVVLSLLLLQVVASSRAPAVACCIRCLTTVG